MKRIRIGIIGAAGRLGREITTLALRDPRFVMAGAYVRPGSLLEGTALEGSLLFSRDLLQGSVDVYLDVSLPSGLAQNLSIALQVGRPLVVGTTGLSEREHEQLRDASRNIPIFYAPNFSIGMALMRKWAAEAAAIFDREAAIELTEIHHAHKKDAPGGSALLLAKTVEENHPEGRTATIHSIREGTVVGEHFLSFKTKEEEIGLQHKAYAREVFARGALAAAHFLVGQPPGLYGMEALLVT